MKTYGCSVCGYSHEGDDAPENCPQCGAIHGTVHEMCKDEARHGMAFQGLLNRFFK